MLRKIVGMPLGIAGILVVTFTIVSFFLLGIEKSHLYISALVFLLISEIALFGGLIWLRLSGENHSRVFLRSGFMVTLGLYFAVTLVTVLLAGIFYDNVNLFILLEFSIIAIFSIILIAVFAFSRRISKSDSAIMAAKSFMETCEKRIQNLLVDASNSDYKQNLSTLYEIIRYSDKVGISSLDSQIETEIANLEAALRIDERDAENIDSILARISTLIKQRKVEINQSKRGGF